MMSKEDYGVAYDEQGSIASSHNEVLDVMCHNGRTLLQNKHGNGLDENRQPDRTRPYACS
jgi:hypothetical protein